MTFTQELRMHKDSLEENADEIIGDVEKKMVAGRSLLVSKTAIRLSSRQIGEIVRHTEAGLRGMEPELSTHVQQEFARPTLLARIDCTETDKYGIRPFEVEERPAGLDVTAMLLGESFTEHIRRHFIQTTGQVPVIARHPHAQSDDGDVLKVVDLNDIKDELCVVRARPDQIPENLKDKVQNVSLSTVLNEGRKEHTIDHVLIRRAKDVQFIPQESIVLKPAQGTHAKGVAVYLSPEDREKHGKKGTVTASKMDRLIKENPDYIVEKFTPPIVLKSREGIRGNMILRVFILVHPKSGVEVIGGAYVVRPELIVHGASNAIAGAITV